jgi:hypothetical protein
VDSLTTNNSSGPTKVCKRCRKPKPIGSFWRRSGANGKTYFRPTCGTCYGKVVAPGNQERLKKYRQDGRMLAYFVKNNAKSADKKKGRENDLDLEFVKTMLVLPCHYCGRHTQFMTLDRIDNSVGHIRTNVVTSCRRCNQTRNSMPFEAWLVVAEGMKRAAELGLFGAWEGQTYEGRNSVDNSR